MPLPTHLGVGQGTAFFVAWFIHCTSQRFDLKRCSAVRGRGSEGAGPGATCRDRIRSVQPCRPCFPLISRRPTNGTGRGRAARTRRPAARYGAEPRLRQSAAGRAGRRPAARWPRPPAVAAAASVGVEHSSNHDRRRGGGAAAARRRGTAEVVFERARRCSRDDVAV